MSGDSKQISSPLAGVDKGEGANFGIASLVVFSIFIILSILVTGCRERNGIRDTGLPANEGLLQVAIKLPDGKKNVFFAEVASTPSERSAGLMFRKSLPEDRGMLFIFDRDDDHSFWMKNTFIPLDMIFISSRYDVVGIVHSAEPLTLTGRSVGKPSRYVLELNGGTSARLGLVEGSKLEFNIGK